VNYTGLCLVVFEVIRVWRFVRAASLNARTQDRQNDLARILGTLPRQGGKPTPFGPLQRPSARAKAGQYGALLHASGNLSFRRMRGGGRSRSRTRLHIQIPANREKNREFFGFGRIRTIRGSLARSSKRCCRRRVVKKCRGICSAPLAPRPRSRSCFHARRAAHKSCGISLTMVRRLRAAERGRRRDLQLKRVDRILDETRAKGYGTRDPSFEDGAYGRQTPDGLSGIAVPHLDRGRIHGVINIVWVKAAREFDDMVRDHLADLQVAATEIVNSLRAQKQSP
jgi:hypothetical protein